MRQLLARGLGLALALALGLCAWLPFAARAAEAPPQTVAEAYVVMDAATGQVLVSQNAHRMEYPASITKILTLGLVLEQVDLAAEGDAPVEVSAAAVDALIPRATMIALGRGEVASLNDLLYATKIESANDAAHALAEYIGGSMEGFAGLMNAKAGQLGLENSHFSNPSGQPADDHYTSAYDMAEITRWALSVPGFRELYGATRYSMAPTNIQPSGREFHNANLALVPGSRYYCEGVVGSKTGYTDQALYTLVTTARRGETELICVVMRCGTNEAKYTDTNALLDYCFDNFRRVSYTPGQEVACKVPVYGGANRPLGEIDVYTEDSVEFLLHNSLQPDVVTVAAEVPQRYVIGGSFAPQATLSIPEGLPQQQGGQLVSMPLCWRGLEDIMAANTTPTMWERMAGDSPVVLGLMVAVPAAVLALVLGRVGYVRARRNKLRQKRLAAARAQLPVRIADRPPPPAERDAALRLNVVDFRRPVTTPETRVALRNGTYDSPRRAGRMR